tara:strand:+ start:138 stop:380 length:243 start_codon:yes stop_codon:yes gene_type:complete
LGEKEALLKEEYFEDAFDKKAEKLEKEREEKRRKFKKFYENSQNQSLKGLIFNYFFRKILSRVRHVQNQGGIWRWRWQPR